MLSPLTRRQKELLDYINTMVTLNGYAPSLQEIRDQFKLKAISTVHEHLENLKNKGYIKKEMNQARGILISNIEELEKFRTIKLFAKLSQDKIGTITQKSDEVIVDKKILSNHKSEIYAVTVADESGKAFGLQKNDLLIVEKGKIANKGNILIQKYGKVRLLEKVMENNVSDHEGVVVGIIRPL